jgi:hypothetical protein
MKDNKNDIGHIVISDQSNTSPELFYVIIQKERNVSTEQSKQKCVVQVVSSIKHHSSFLITIYVANLISCLP